MEIRKKSSKGSNGIWQGCPAGKGVVGIRANGYITGCLSIRNDNFIEGNIRQTPLTKLWTQPGAFAWNRELSRDKLTGFCATCQYGAHCRGGCSGVKITMHNCTTCNDYCLFSVTAKKEKERARGLNDVCELVSKAKKFISSEDYQFAEIYLYRALEIEPENVEILDIQRVVEGVAKN